jgi:hypothetical protein
MAAPPCENDAVNMNWYPVDAGREPPAVGDYRKRNNRWHVWTGSAWLAFPEDLHAECVAREEAVNLAG